MRPILASALLALSVPLAAGAQGALPLPTHAYHVDGSLDDVRGGPSLVGQGGTVGATSYVFGSNQGVTLVGAVAPQVYTLELSFSLATVSDYRKLVDFAGGTRDAGIYVHHGFLAWAGNGNIDGTRRVFAADTPTHLVLARDADRRVTGWVNGERVLSFLDRTDDAVFGGAQSLARFFLDDGVVTGEHSAGALFWLRTYDVALTDAEVAERFAAGDDPVPPLTTTTPEPGTLALLAAGGALLAVARRRRVGAPGA